MSGITPRLHAVQTTACAPLARAWERSQSLGGPKQAGAHWTECMWPWESVGASAADGILDDETYDWLAVVRAMLESGGGPVVVDEATLVRANEVARTTTGVAVDPTGASGLAGLLQTVQASGLRGRIAVVFSGRDRDSCA